MTTIGNMKLVHKHTTCILNLRSSHKWITQTLHYIIVLKWIHIVLLYPLITSLPTLLRCLMIPLDKLPSTFIITSMTCSKQWPVRLCNYICDWICKRGSYTCICFLTLRIYNLYCVIPTDLKFGCETHLSLLLHQRKFSLIHYSQIKLYHFKFSKPDTCTRPHFTNPVTYLAIITL